MLTFPDCNLFPLASACILLLYFWISCDALILIWFINKYLILLSFPSITFDHLFTFPYFSSGFSFHSKIKLTPRNYFLLNFVNILSFSPKCFYSSMFRLLLSQVDWANTDYANTYRNFVQGLSSSRGLSSLDFFIWAFFGSKSSKNLYLIRISLSLANVKFKLIL